MKIKDPPCPGCNGVVILTSVRASVNKWTIYCPVCEIQMIPQKDKKRLIRTWGYFTAAIAVEKSKKSKTKRPLTDVTRPFRFDEQHDEQHVNNVGVS